MDELCLTALTRFGAIDGLRIEPLGDGLINRTYRVTGKRGAFVLQCVNAIFDPAIHDNIEAVTRRLAARGLATPELQPSVEGALYARLDDGSIWRLWSYVEGVSFATVASPAQAGAAGELLGTFHRALEELDHDFVGLRLGVHDTDAHLGSLVQSLSEERAHRLHQAVARLGAAVADAAARLPALPPLAPRIGHGDPKISNVIFAGVAPPARDRAICLVDLDTVGPILLAHELGDAWRSWCSRAAEDAEDASFDMDRFEASLRGYLAGAARSLEAAERQALLQGVEWISLELSARFATDALRERYFGWDASRYPGRGEHNLARAQNQLALHHAMVATRAERARLLDC